MKLLAVGALALAMVAAGCLTTPAPVEPAALADGLLVGGTTGIFHAADGRLVDAGDDVVRAIGGQYSTGVAASEPTIGVTSDGFVFMTGSVPNPSCAPAGGCPVVPYANFNRGPTIMRSTDKGLTWEDVFPKLPTGDSYKLRSWDPYVFVDRDTDRVFMDDIYPLGCGFTSFSDDRGDSWMHNPLACGNPQLNDHQTIGTAKPRVLSTVGYPNLVYRCVNNGFYIGCAISLNGGLHFLPQIPVTSAIGNCGGITGHLESDPEGRMYLPITCNNKPAFALTEDDGRTWTIGTIAEGHDLHGLHVDMAVDEAGNVYALWESDYLPYVAWSTDHGATWSEPIMVGAPGVTMVKFNAIAAGAPGRIAFAYVGTAMPDAPSLPTSQCGALPAFPCTEPEEWASATWNAYLGVIEDALGPSPIIQSVTANELADPLARGACAGRCNGMTDFIDVAIDLEGRPWASFVDVCVADCVTDASIPFDGNFGFAATLREGPALRGDARSLVPLVLPPLPARG